SMSSLDTIHDRHAYIHQNNVRLEVFACTYSLFSISSFTDHDNVVGTFEPGPDGRPGDQLIFDQQNSYLRSLGCDMFINHTRFAMLLSFNISTRRVELSNNAGWCSAGRGDGGLFRGSQAMGIEIPLNISVAPPPCTVVSPNGVIFASVETGRAFGKSA